nr:hypothetical protein [Tanacetum cinerariifolium]
MCSLVRLPAGKKASQRLWMFKVKEEQDGSKSTKARFTASWAERKPKVQIEGIYVWTDSSTETTVDDMLVAGSDMTKFNKPKWKLPLVFEMKDICSEKQLAKLVRILISEGSLSLLRILGMKSLAEMFTRLVMKENLKFCAAPTSL